MNKEKAKQRLDALENEARELNKNKEKWWHLVTDKPLQEQE